MSFRRRALGVILLVVVAATALTALLTTRETLRQVRTSGPPGREQLSLVADGLTTYVAEHGTWARVGPTVVDVARRSGQRVRVVVDGRMIADSDALQHLDPRPDGGVPMAVATSPALVLLPRSSPADSVVSAIEQLDSWSQTLPLAACLTEQGFDVRISPQVDGGARLERVPDTAPAVQACQRRVGADSLARTAQAKSAFDGCLAVPAPGRPESDADRSSVDTTCLRITFAQRVASVSPAQVQVGVGPQGDRPLSPGPIVALVGLVVLASAAAALLLGRTVLRPVRRLTTAAERIGAGQLEHRVPVHGSDEIARLAIAFNEMTDALKNSEARQRQLVADVAHELRTPLSTLRGYLEALEDGVVDLTPDLLTSLQAEVAHQQRIVEDLQQLSLADAGRPGYQWAAVDLVVLAAEVCEAWAGAFAENEVELTAVVPEHAVVVNADPTRLRQVLANLLSNAMRATPPQGRVEVAVTEIGDRCQLVVSDTGHGIESADLERVFDRFWRADRARSRGEGIGLGLSIVRRIAHDHGGTVSVTSEAGHGATFTVDLPRAEWVAAAAVPHASGLLQHVDHVPLDEELATGVRARHYCNDPRTSGSPRAAS